MIKTLAVGLLLAIGFGAGGVACSSPEPAPTADEAQNVVASPPAVREVAPPGTADSEPDCFVIVDGEPDIGSPPLTVRFETEVDCTGAPVTYSWDFGDGSRAGNEPHPSHTYEKEGDFVVVVRVTAPDGGESDDELDITVDASEE